MQDARESINKTRYFQLGKLKETREQSKNKQALK
jgi:hypothetical protein